MVNKRVLTNLELSSIDEYFECIIDNKESGKHDKAQELFEALSSDDGVRYKGQKTRFFDWVETTYYYDADDCNEMTTEMQKFKHYFLNK